MDDFVFDKSDETKEQDVNNETLIMNMKGKG